MFIIKWKLKLEKEPSSGGKLSNWYNNKTYIFRGDAWEKIWTVWRDRNNLLHVEVWKYVLRSCNNNVFDNDEKKWHSLHDVADGQKAAEDVCVRTVYSICTRRRCKKKKNVSPWYGYNTNGNINCIIESRLHIICWYLSVYS